MSTTELVQQPAGEPVVATPQTLAELVEQLGGIPLERIWCTPPPGTATEEDLLKYMHFRGGKYLLELIDGVLVEKAVGLRESILAAILIQYLRNFIQEDRLGWVVGADGPHRLHAGVVRYPDVGFIARERFPDGLPDDAIGRFAPDLAVEVLSSSNTAREMQLKREAYFAAGVRLVWEANHRTRTVRVYHNPDDFQELTASDELDGEDVLPDFRLAVDEWFAEAD
jgi:Uma2 family endonuclease